MRPHNHEYMSAADGRVVQEREHVPRREDEVCGRAGGVWGGCCGVGGWEGWGGGWGRGGWEGGVRGRVGECNGAEGAGWRVGG